MLACLVALWPASAAGVEEGDPPEIVNVAVPGRPVAGRAVTARLTYRAQQGNVVAVIVEVEDLDGPSRVTSQREISVVAAAFGREEGDLWLPLGFATPGRRRVTFTLVTDEREESDPATIDVDVGP
jgi:hypothetical protein